MLPKAYDKDTLRPVTIRQIHTSEELHPGGEIRIDDAEVTRISFIGQIRNISKQTTNTTFKLDDGTGTMEAKDWTDMDRPSVDELGNPMPGAKAPLEVGNWAKVYGSIKFVNNRRHVSIVIIRPIKDYNEISYHLLEATYVHLYVTRGPLEQQANAAGGAADGYGQQEQGYGQQGGGYDAATGMNQGAMQNLGMSAKKVLQCLTTSPQTNEGLHVHVIASSTGLQPAEVIRAAEDLVNRSLIFTTVDDHTWALLEQ